MTRLERALSMTVTRPPTQFQHSPTPGKPAPPATSLGTEDFQRYTFWTVTYEGGMLTPVDTANASPALQTAMSAFADYVASSAYVAWKAVDDASRFMQYRLTLVDVATAVDAKATIPISTDPMGIGTLAPSVAEIGIIGAAPPVVAPEYVVVGGPSSELVFGDDGDIVTVG